MTAQTARGVRNNNPTNMERNGTKWQGMADDQSSDPRFIVFKTAEMGIRAPARTLLTYQNQYGLNTIRKIINRWAPPVENDTGAYVAHVAKLCGVGPDQIIDVDSVVVMKPLMDAIIAHECAGFRYPDAVVLEGLRLAGVADAKPRPLVKSNSFQAQAVSGVAVVGAIATQAATHVTEGAVQVAGHAASYAPAVANAAHQLDAFNGSPVIAHVVTVLLTVAGGLTAVGLFLDFLKHRSS